MEEADAAVAERKKPPEDSGPRIIGEGLVIDEWVSYPANFFRTQCNFKTSSDILYPFTLLLYRKSEEKDILLNSKSKE